MSNQTTVYRIELSTTKGGMYTGGCGLYEIMNSCGWDGNQDRHPAPESDSALMQSGVPRNAWGIGDIAHLHFGFASIAQLRNWLYNDDWLVGLSKKGYVLAEYRSDEVYAGSTQAVFKRPTRRYRKHDIIEYFKLTKGEPK